MFDIRRREFIALFGSAAVWPLSVHAQQSERVQRIGVLMGHLESDPDAQAWYAAFREGLQKLGWTEGRNIRIDTRWAAPDDAGSMLPTSPCGTTVRTGRALQAEMSDGETGSCASVSGP